MAAICTVFLLDIRIEIFENLPTFYTLSNMLIAFPLDIHLLKRHHIQIFTNLWDRLPYDIQQLITVIVNLRNQPSEPDLMESLIKEYLDRNADALPLPALLLESPITVLKAIAELEESIELLSESFARRRVLDPSQEHESQISPSELRRIRRAFWRFQLCYDLAHPQYPATLEGSPTTNDRKSHRFVHSSPGDRGLLGKDGYANTYGAQKTDFPPKVMSLLARLSDRETGELDAIRFHLSTEVNALQFHRKAETEDYAFKNTRILLQRLIQDVDHCLSNPEGPGEHILVVCLHWPFKHFHPSRIYGERSECKRDAGSVSADEWTFLVLKQGSLQWGWCMWDREWLGRRGLLNCEVVEEYFSDTVMTHGALQDEEIWRLEEVDDAMSAVGKPNSLISTGLIGGNFELEIGG